MPSATTSVDARSQARPEPAPHEGPNLAGRYGSIGIPAVAAAARYHVAARNPAYAPSPQPDLVADAVD